MLTRQSVNNLMVGVTTRLAPSCAAAGARRGPAARSPWLVGAAPAFHSRGPVKRFCLDTSSATVVVDAISDGGRLDKDEGAALDELLVIVAAAASKQDRTSAPPPGLLDHERKEWRTLGLVHWIQPAASPDHKGNVWWRPINGSDLQFEESPLTAAEGCDSWLKSRFKNVPGAHWRDLGSVPNPRIWRRSLRYVDGQVSAVGFCYTTSAGARFANVNAHVRDAWLLDDPRLMNHVVKLLGTLMAPPAPRRPAPPRTTARRAPPRVAASRAPRVPPRTTARRAPPRVAASQAPRAAVGTTARRPPSSARSRGEPGGLNMSLAGAYAKQADAAEAGLGAVVDVDHHRLHTWSGFGWMTGVGGAAGGIQDYGGLFELRASAGAGWTSGVFALSVGVGLLVGGVGAFQPDNPILDTEASYAGTLEAWLHLNLAPVRVDVFGIDTTRRERRLGARLTFGYGDGTPAYTLGFLWHQFHGSGQAHGDLYLAQLGIVLF